MSNDPIVKAAGAPVDRKERARRIAALVVGILIIVFAAVNLDEVEVNWIVATSSTPLIIVIAVSFVLGLAGGYLLRGRRASRAGSKHH